jgi:uncharacterized membrane protein
MKKLIIFFTLLCFAIPVLAEEVILQDIQNDNTYLGINIEKTPNKDTGGQLITNHKSFLVINIIVNSKVKSKTNTEE